MTRRADASAAACPLASAISLSVSLWSSNRLNAVTPIRSATETAPTTASSRRVRTPMRNSLAPHRNE